MERPKERKKEEKWVKIKIINKIQNLLSFWNVMQCSLVQLPRLLGRSPMQFLQSTSRHHCVKIT